MSLYYQMYIILWMKSYKYDWSCFTRFCMFEYLGKHYRLSSSSTQPSACYIHPYPFLFAEVPCFWICLVKLLPFSALPSVEQTTYPPQLINWVSSTSLVFVFTVPTKSVYVVPHSFLSSDREALYFDSGQIDKFPVLKGNYCIFCIEIVTS